MRKLVIALREENLRFLNFEASQRGITMQELIRAVIVPDWVRASFGDRRDENSSLPTVRLERQENEIAPILTRTRR